MAWRHQAPVTVEPPGGLRRPAQPPRSHAGSPQLSALKLRFVRPKSATYGHSHGAGWMSAYSKEADSASTDTKPTDSRLIGASDRSARPPQRTGIKVERPWPGCALRTVAFGSDRSRRLRSARRVPLIGAKLVNLPPHELSAPDPQPVAAIAFRDVIIAEMKHISRRNSLAQLTCVILCWNKASFCQRNRLAVKTEAATISCGGRDAVNTNLCYAGA